MAGLNITEDEMKTIVAKAILDGISGDAKNQIISAAVKALLDDADPRGYGRPKETILQQQFNYSVRNVAIKAVEEYIQENTELYGRIKTQIWELLDGLPREAIDDYDVQGAVISALLVKLRDRDR